MSILKPTKSITRFDVSGLPDIDGQDISETILHMLNAYSIKEMEIGEEIVWGWTSLLNTYEPVFDDMSFMTGNFVTVGMRVDRKTIPSKVLKKEIYLAEKKVMEEKQIPKIGRAMKVMIKESVTANLLKDTPAVPTSYDIVWNVGDQMIYLFSTQKLAREILEEMIRECFNLELTMLFPFTMAEKSADEKDIMTLTQTIFT